MTPVPRKSGEYPSMRVTLGVEAGVARITLNRPEKRNALDAETIRQLGAAFEASARDDTARVVVLAAAGPDFCAGADLDSLADLLDADEQVHRADAQALADLFLKMRELPKPIIGAVHGRAFAGGAGLVSACDIVMAAHDAQIAYTEVKIGFVPAMVTALLRCTVLEKMAFDLIASGRTVGADEAVQIGLVTAVVPTADLDGAVMRRAAELAALPPEAVSRSKRLFYEMQGLRLREALDRGVDENVAARGTAAVREGLAKFFARRR